MSSFTLAAAFRIALGVLLLCSACTKHRRNADDGLRTRTLLVGNQSEPASLDPHIMGALSEMRVAVALFEGLTVIDEKTAQPIPGVAERWDISADGLTYTFHLRPNAKWSNGERLTAQDFVSSFRRILTPALGAVYAHMLWPIKNAEAFRLGKVTDFNAVGVSAPNEATLRVTLARPTPYLLTLATHQTWFPIHRPTIEKFGHLDERDTPWTRPGNLVGNGAFVLSEWSPNSRIIVTKNPHYWGAPQNNIERVTLFPMEKAEPEELAFRAGQLHVTASLPASKVESYRQKTPELLRIEPLLLTEFVSFNITKPPLNLPKVRRALALALSRAAISARIYASARAPAHTLVPPGCGGYTPPAGQPDDFAAARALLAEAGFKDGQGMPVLPLLVSNESPKAAEAIQALWQRELGVRITIEPVELKSQIDSVQKLDYMLALAYWSADYLDPFTFLEVFRTGNNILPTGWSSKDYDALLEQSSFAADAAKRFAILQRAESILLEEAPIAPLVHGATVFAIHPAVKNWQPSVLGFNRYQIVRLNQ
jgi:oligopeptide transport system substrate-binding protein